MAYVNEPLGAVGRESAGRSALRLAMTPGTKEAAAQQAFIQQAQAAGFNRSSTAQPQDYLQQFTTASGQQQTMSKNDPAPSIPAGPAPVNQTASAPQFAPAPDFSQVGTQSATNSTVGAPAGATSTPQTMEPWKIAAIGGGVLIGVLLLGRLVKGIVL